MKMAMKTTVSFLVTVVFLFNSMVSFAKSSEDTTKKQVFQPAIPDVIEKLDLPHSISEPSVNPDNYIAFFTQYGYLLAQQNIECPEVYCLDFNSLGYSDFISYIARGVACNVNAKNEVLEYDFLMMDSKGGNYADDLIRAIAALEYGGKNSENMLKKVYNTTPVSQASAIISALLDLLLENNDRMEKGISRFGVQTDNFIYAAREIEERDDDGKSFFSTHVVATPVRK